MQFFRFFDSENNWFPVVIEGSLLDIHLSAAARIDCECEAHTWARIVGGYDSVSSRTASLLFERGRYATISDVLSIELFR
jgi:hypothetical protein